MSQAQALSRLHIAEDKYAKIERTLADTKAATEVTKAKRKNRSLAVGAGGMDLEDDPEVAMLKYKMWKPKMTCEACMDQDQDNDVEVFLPCQHLLCSECVQSLIRERKRSCPFCRSKFTELQA